MPTAIIHDWLTGMRGGEKVLESIGALYPDAELFTLLNVPGSTSAAIARHRVTASFVQWLPAARRLYRHYLPLFPIAIEQFDLDPFDLVISSSHCAAKAVVATGRARHVCYCHSPMRYAWDQFDAYFGRERAGRLGEAALRPLLARMARWDAATASRVHRFVANSQFVADRIGRYYGRRADVVHPPVDTEFFHPGGVPPADHFLVVSALVPYKRVDLAIDACRRTGAALRVVGTGPDRGRLERAAGASVTFLGQLSDEAIRDEYRRARAVILAGEEDFGIVPVEAQACGCPVVAFGRGGALETVVDGDTGVFFGAPTADAIADGLERMAALRFDPSRIRAHAEAFSRSRFAARFSEIVEDTRAKPAGTRW
jgi:glycosyltransferase involved in cell wall biosynthesis